VGTPDPPLDFPSFGRFSIQSRPTRPPLAPSGIWLCHITQYGVEAARQISFLVEKSHDAVHSLSHRSVRESLNQSLKSEAAKLLAKAHLNRATGTGGAGNTESGSSAGGAAADA
jgi:hypothetical protein